MKKLLILILVVFAFYFPGKASAAISFVQVATSSAGSAATTSTVTLSSVTSGNTILVAFGENNASSMSVSDGTNTYVLDASSTSGSSVKVGVFRASNVASGNTSITVTSGSAGTITVVATEYSGIATSAPTDASTTNASTGSTFTAGNITTNADNELIFVAPSVNGDVNNSFSPAANFTKRASVEFNPPNSGKITAVEDRIPVTGTYDTGGTWAVNDASPWVGAAVAYKVAAGGGSAAKVKRRQTVIANGD